MIWALVLLGIVALAVVSAGFRKLLAAVLGLIVVLALAVAVSLLILLGFINGLRGIRAYNRLRKQPDADDEALASRSL
jgi:hypothetical protein